MTNVNLSVNKMREINELTEVMIRASNLKRRTEENSENNSLVETETVFTPK